MNLIWDLMPSCQTMCERSFLHWGQTRTKCFDPLSGREPGLVWVQGMVFGLVWFLWSQSWSSWFLFLLFWGWESGVCRTAIQSWGFEVWVPLVCVVLFCIPTSHGSVELIQVKWQGDIRVRPGYELKLLCVAIYTYPKHKVLVYPGVLHPSIHLGSSFLWVAFWNEVCCCCCLSCPSGPAPTVTEPQILT